MVVIKAGMPQPRMMMLWLLTHCGPVTQICVLHYNSARRMMQICVFNTRFVSMHYTLNYAIHGAFLRMVPLTDVSTRVGTLIVATIYLN